MKDLFVDDILNRMPGHTLPYTNGGNKVKYELKNGEDVIYSATGTGSKAHLNALLKIRESVIGAEHRMIKFSLTTQQINDATNVTKGAEAFDTDLDVLKVYNGSSWVTT